jgi:hypothetical protein
MAQRMVPSAHHAEYRESMTAGGSCLLQPGMSSACLKKPGSASRVGSGRMPLICLVYLQHHPHDCLLRTEGVKHLRLELTQCEKIRHLRAALQSCSLASGVSHSRGRDAVAVARAAEGISRHLHQENTASISIAHHAV